MKRILILAVGERLRCRLDNNKLPQGEKKQDCNTIVVAPLAGSSCPG